MRRVMILIFTTSSVLAVADSWTKLTSGTLAHFYSIASINSKRGVAVGRDGVIIESTDGGTTWKSQHTPSGTKSLFGLCAVDSFNLAADESGALIYFDSVNTGKPGVWTNTNNNPFTDSLFEACFARDTAYDSINGNFTWRNDYKTFYLVGKEGVGEFQVHYELAVFPTSIGPESLTTVTANVKQFVSSNIPASSIRCVVAKGKTIYAAGDGGEFLKSTNAGITWTHLIFDSSANPNSIALFGKSSLFIVGDSGKMWSSTDGGSHWIKKHPDGLTEKLNGVTCVDSAGTGVAVGDHGLILKTLDFGNTWKRQSCTVFVNLHSVSCYNGDNGFGASWLIAGDSGTILRCEFGGDTTNISDIIATVDSVRWLPRKSFHKNFGGVPVNGGPHRLQFHFNSTIQT